MMQSDRLTPEQEREIIESINDVITDTGFGEVVIELKNREIAIIKAIYRKPKKRAEYLNE